MHSSNSASEHEVSRALSCVRCDKTLVPGGDHETFFVCSGCERTLCIDCLHAAARGHGFGVGEGKPLFYAPSRQTWVCADCFAAEV